MSFQEIRAITTSFTTVLILVLYYLIILNNYNHQFYIDNVDFSFWGTVILMLIPVLVIAQIVIHILLHIVLAILTRGKEDLSLEDERDKLIELKATRNFYHAFMAGFFFGIGILAFGFSPILMFNIFLLTILIAAIVEGISQFIYYRKGI